MGKKNPFALFTSHGKSLTSITHTLHFAILAHQEWLFSCAYTVTGNVDIHHVTQDCQTSCNMQDPFDYCLTLAGKAPPHIFPARQYGISSYAMVSWAASWIMKLEIAQGAELLLDICHFEGPCT